MQLSSNVVYCTHPGVGEGRWDSTLSLTASGTWKPQLNGQRRGCLYLNVAMMIVMMQH